jgi:hypothetical protein
MIGAQAAEPRNGARRFLGEALVLEEVELRGSLSGAIGAAVAAGYRWLSGRLRRYRAHWEGGELRWRTSMAKS